MRRFALFILSVAIMCCLSQELRAQSSITYGYSSVSYDESSDTVTAYASTEPDYYATYYYSAEVQATVTDGDGNYLGSLYAYEPSNIARASLQRSGTGAERYDIVATHTLQVNYSGYYYVYYYGQYPGICCSGNYYRDRFYYSFYRDQSIDVPSYFSFLGSGNDTPVVDQRQRMGKTRGRVSVQIPRSLSVVSIDVLPTSSDPSTSGCTPDSGDYGIKVAVRYQVKDRNGDDIRKNNMVPQERVTDVYFEGIHQGDPVPNWDDIGPSRNSQTSRTTDSDGRFVDAPYGICGPRPFTSYKFKQEIGIVIGNRRYLVRTNNVEASSATYGGGTISNGSDIQKSRQ